MRVNRLRNATTRGAVLAAAATLLIASPLAAQDVVFGATTSLETGIRGSLDDTSALSPFAAMELAPELAVFADTAELRASASLQLAFPASYELAGDPGISTTGSGRDRALTGSIDTLKLRLYPLDWLTVDAGLQRHIQGAGILLSPVDFLSPVVLETGAGELPATAGPAALLGATAFVGSGWIAAFVAPAPSVVQWPQVESSVLNDIPVLAELTDTVVAAGTLTRSSLTLGGTSELSEPWRRISAELSAGIPAGPVDLTVLAYHGVDRVPTVTATVDTGGVPAGEYTLEATLQEANVTALGISAQTAVGPAMLWADGSLVLDRVFGTTNVLAESSSGVYPTETVTAPHVEVVAGGLAMFDRPRMTVAAEYRHGFIGSDLTNLIRLDFPGTALLSVSGDWLDGLVTTSAAAIVLIPDASAVVIASARVSPSSELSAWLQAPVVIAGDGSLLAGLGSTLSVTAGLSYRF